MYSFASVLETCCLQMFMNSGKPYNKFWWMGFAIDSPYVSSHRILKVNRAWSALDRNYHIMKHASKFATSWRPTIQNKCMSKYIHRYSTHKCRVKHKRNNQWRVEKKPVELMENLRKSQ